MVAKVETVQTYLESFPEPVRSTLAELRDAVLAVAPGATESISYGMPTVLLNGRLLVYFAGWKKHVALYSVVVLTPELEAELRPFRTEKDTVRFPAGEPVPADLVGRVTKALMEVRMA
jgi:uncharacterized protein YdhG (YjbR/CyaY superfamily)